MKVYKAGVDIGSTTVKLVILDENNETVFGEYRRHCSKTQQTLAELLKEAKEKLKATFEKMKSELVPLLVVTEVKSRNSDEFGTGAESVGYLKQKNIVVGAKFYQKNFKYENYGLRFDVASVDFGGVEYIENAFYERHFY